MSDWISVKDRLPEDTKAVLVWTPENLCMYTGYLRDTMGRLAVWAHFGGMGGTINKEVTHWMPIPEPPK